MVGRSSGWVIVCGLRPVAEWNQRQRQAWARFEREIAKSIKDAEKLWHDEVREHSAEGTAPTNVDRC